jgi:hypothetical protein
MKMDDDRVNQLVQQWLHERGYAVTLLSLQKESGMEVQIPDPGRISPSTLACRDPAARLPLFCASASPTSATRPQY